MNPFWFWLIQVRHQVFKFHSRFFSHRTLVYDTVAFFFLLLLIPTVGCSAINSEGPPSPTIVTPSPPSLETAPTPSPESTIDLPTAPPFERLDFRDIIPIAPPPGLGKQSNHLVFFSNRTGQYELYEINPDGSNLVALTSNSQRDMYDMDPAWSPDGQRIAFASPHVNGSWEVFILEVANGRWTQATEFGSDSWSMTWSPDSQSLAFVSNTSGDEEIYLVGIDGKKPVNLTHNPIGNDYLPNWSPDGQQIAFVSNRKQGEDDIFIMAADGTAVTPLTGLDGLDGRDNSPDWSPDGQKIAFVTDRDDNFEIYTIAPDGSNLTRLTNHPAYEWSPTWSPDGKIIAFTSTREHTDTYDLFIMNADGSNTTRLTSDPANDIIPNWWQ